MRIGHPHAGPSTTFLFFNSTKIVHFFNVFKKKKLVLIPLTGPPYNFCSKGPRGLKFVVRIDPLHAGPTTTFLFFNCTKVHFFNCFILCSVLKIVFQKMSRLVVLPSYFECGLRYTSATVHGPTCAFRVHMGLCFGRLPGLL